MARQNQGEISSIRFRDSRHANATLILVNGEHPKNVQERLGNANISMTLDLYYQVTIDMQRDAADQMDQLIASSQLQAAFVRPVHDVHNTEQFGHSVDSD